MRVRGYKLNAYNLTYEPTLFDIQEGTNAMGNRVLEVEDVEAGVRFIFEYEEKRPKKKKPYKHQTKNKKSPLQNKT